MKLLQGGKVIQSHDELELEHSLETITRSGVSRYPARSVHECRSRKLKYIERLAYFSPFDSLRRFRLARHTLGRKLGQLFAVAWRSESRAPFTCAEKGDVYCKRHWPFSLH